MPSKVVMNRVILAFASAVMASYAVISTIAVVLFIRAW